MRLAELLIEYGVSFFGERRQIQQQNTSSTIFKGKALWKNGELLYTELGYLRAYMQFQAGTDG